MPGKCAFGGPVSELLATMACTQTFAEQCRSAVVYTQGLDGCSDKLVLLKSADPVPSNTFAAPTVFTMERVEGASVGATPWGSRGTSCVSRCWSGDMDGARAAWNRRLPCPGQLLLL